MSELGRPQYYNNEAYSVLWGAVDQELDLLAALQADGRGTYIGPATYLVLDTDLTVTFKINATTSDAITLTTAGLTIPGGVMAISKLYFTRGIASSAITNATLSIFAS